MHMTAWRIFVIKKLEGDQEYKVAEEMNFPSSNNWSEALQALDDSQAALLQALESFDNARLYEIVRHSSYNYSYYTLLHGLIHHDLYHAGQIALTRKQSI
jgi:uncharacterized damage-inducible protein DinB